MLEGLQTPRGVSRRLPEGFRGPVNSIHPAVISPVMPVLWAPRQALGDGGRRWIRWSVPIGAGAGPSPIQPF